MGEDKKAEIKANESKCSIMSAAPFQIPVQIPQFDGNTSTEEWITDIEEFGEACQLNSHQLFFFAKNSFTGTAKDLMRAMMRLQKVRTWDALKVLVREMYPPLDAHDGTNRLQNCLQGSRSVSEYVADFVSIAEQSPVLETLKIHLFRRNLQPNMSMCMLAIGKQYESLSDIIKHAISMERIAEEFIQVEEPYEEEDIDALTREFGQLKTRLLRARQNAGMSCRHCRCPDHLSADCAYNPKRL